MRICICFCKIYYIVTVHLTLKLITCLMYNKGHTNTSKGAIRKKVIVKVTGRRFK